MSRGDSSGSSWRRANSDRSSSKSFLDQWGLGGNSNNNNNYNDNRNNGRGPFQWFRDMIDWLEDFFLYRVPSFMQAPLAIHALLWPNILVFGAWKWVFSFIQFLIFDIILIRPAICSVVSLPCAG
jgi:hypothetical protein